MEELYNEELQIEAPEVVEEVLAAEEAKELTVSEQYELLLNNPGWQLLAGWLITQVDDCKTKLIDADEARVPRLQQRAKAFAEVLDHVHRRIENAKFLREKVSLTHQDPSLDG